MLVRAVVFDAVGTLLHARPTVAEAYQAVGRRHGVALELDELRVRFRMAMAAEDRRDRALGGRTSEARELERWQRIVAAVFDSLGDTRPLFDDLWQHFATPQNWQVDPSAAELIARLSSGVQLALASNFDARLHGICAALPPLDVIDRRFVSSEVAWRKPRREFFAAVGEQLQLPPDEILLVGDDLENDYLGARVAAWQARWLSATPHPSVPETDRLTSLADLVVS